jgi:hypothetical protein
MGEFKYRFQTTRQIGSIVDWSLYIHPLSNVTGARRVKKEILLPFTQARETHSLEVAYQVFQKSTFHVPARWSGRRESNGPSAG